jgi:N-acetylmuramic acid 6-phosphate etherase
MLMLQGWEGHPGLASLTFVKSIAVAAAKAGDALSRGGGVILSGAGSSGRLAAHASASFNRLLPPSIKGKFLYTIAGGDGAIVKSAEALEDSPSAALQDLRDALASLSPPAAAAPPCVLVGITCGMSATYVGSQLESALADSSIFPVLVGFNPVERARDVVIPAWGKSFKELALVMARAHSDGAACLLNPVVGPEVVTGSTRMKSGSVTKIILEIICSVAITCASAAAPLTPLDIQRSVTDLINLYSNAVAATYASTELSLPILIAKSSQYLRAASSQPSPAAAPPSGGRILYASDVTCAGPPSPPPPTPRTYSNTTPILLLPPPPPPLPPSPARPAHRCLQAWPCSMPASAPQPTAPPSIKCLKHLTLQP